MSENKRFEDYPKVDCNECEPWWLNQCDGVPKGSQRVCNSFLASRNVVIPARLNKLEKSVKRLTWVMLLLALSCFLNAISDLVARYG